MTLHTIKVASKKNLPKLPIESSYIKRIREGREERAKQAADKIQKEKDEKIEEKRMHKLLIPYLDKLQGQLVEKNLLYFWVYPDQPGFIKHNNLTVSKLQKLFFQDVEKYKNRLIASISIGFYHHDEHKDKRFKKIYMTTSIEVIHIDKYGKMHGEKEPWGCNMAWYADDFKTTTFSFKLMEIIYRQTAARVIRRTSIFGFPATDIIHELQEKGQDFGNVLKPLPGSII